MGSTDPFPKSIEKGKGNHGAGRDMTKIHPGVLSIPCRSPTEIGLHIILFLLVHDCIQYNSDIYIMFSLFEDSINDDVLKYMKLASVLCAHILCLAPQMI